MFLLSVFTSFSHSGLQFLLIRYFPFVISVRDIISVIQMLKRINFKEDRVFHLVLQTSLQSSLAYSPEDESADPLRIMSHSRGGTLLKENTLRRMSFGIVGLLLTSERCQGCGKSPVLFSQLFPGSKAMHFLINRYCVQHCFSITHAAEAKVDQISTIIQFTRQQGNRSYKSK